jgi:predicted nucleotidyltransferase
MSERSVPQVAIELRRRLEARFGPRLRQVRLFGSYARGAAHETSDVDLLVVVDDLTHSEKVEVSDLAVEASLGSGLTLAPLVWSAVELARLRSLELGLVENIDREGVAV